MPVLTRSAPCLSCGTPRVEIVLSERLGVALWCECCDGPAPQTPAPAVQRITTRPEDLTEIRRSWSERIGDGIGASSLLWLALVLWVLAGLVGAS